MVKEHTITFVIKLGGEMETTVEGIDGPECEKATEWLDRLGKVVRHEHTADYHAHVSQETVKESVNVGTGDNEGGNHGSPW